MNAREFRPDALIIGAAKAGTSALHAALAQHPQIYAAPVKEPKYYMCWDAPPPSYRGPGDAHSNQEWIWRRADYQALFRGAPDEAVRLESTPFYLYMPGARRRIAEELREAKLIVVVRDPIDRAYSNWMHLWVWTGWNRHRTSWRPGRQRTGGSPLGGHRFGTIGGWARTASSSPIYSASSNRTGSWFFAIGSWCPTRTRRSIVSHVFSALPKIKLRPSRPTMLGRSWNRGYAPRCWGE